VAGYDAILTIKVIADATQAAAGLDKAEAAGGKFGGAMRKAALPAAAVGAAVVALGKKAVDAASDLQQANGAVEAVFGKGLAAAVDKNAKAAATTMGLSAAQYKNYAALVGTSLQNAGFSASQAVEESNKVMQRGADLSALYGGTTADAVDAINAAVSRSEFDPLEKYGVSLNMTKVNALLAAKGQDKLTGSALETAKKQAILSQIYKDTGKAAGQYAREADSVAGKQQTAAAQWENAAATLGEVLLPVVAKVTGYLSQFATWAQKNATVVQIFAGALLALAAAVLAVNAAMKIYQAGMIVFTAIQKAATAASLGTRIGLAALAVQEKLTAVTTWLLNSALLANPITWVVVGVVALIAAFVLLYRNSKTVRNAIDALWSGMKSGAQAAWQAVKRAFSAILGAARSTFNWIKRNWPLILAIITGPIGLAVLAVVRNWGRIKDATRNLISSIRQIWSNLSGAVGTIVGRIREIWSNAIGAIKEKAASLASAVTNPFKTLKGIIDGVIGSIDSLIGKIGSLIGKLGSIHWPTPPKFLSKLPGFSSFSATTPGVASPGRAALMSAAPGVVSPRARGVGSSAPGGVSITVNGAIDPEATARQIRRVLDGHTRRVGLAT
jgi:hypothetical protein